jgi:hypothetical protein
LAVDKGTGDLYVADVGVSEVQSVKVSATAGRFKLTFEGKSTVDLPFDASAGFVEEQLVAAIGAPNVNVEGGPGDETGSTPYRVTFTTRLVSTDVPQLGCANGATPLIGGSGCSVTTPTQGVASEVKRFHSDGTPDGFSALGSNALGELAFGGNPGVLQLAVDGSGGLTDGDIYVNESSKGRVDVFGASGSLLGLLTESSGGPLGPPVGVAVDESGALYVSDALNLIHRYVPTANPPLNGGPPGGDNVANFTGPKGTGVVAVGAGPSAGLVFVRGREEVQVLDSATGELKSVIVPTGEPTTLTVDPVSGHLYVAIGSEVIEYDVSAGAATVVSRIGGSATVTGVAVNGASGNVYVARKGSAEIEVYGPIPVLPQASSEPPSEISPGGSTLNGTVNPDGQPLTAEGCFFEWGETTSYGKTASCEEPDATEVGEGSSPVSVHAKISGLRVGSTYHYRLIAKNTLGSVEGHDEQLLTLGPSISGQAVSQITATEARVDGEVNPRGHDTSFQVQYVTDTQWKATGYAEATSSPVAPAPVGSGSAFTPVSARLLGLSPATIYHFRLVASSEVATNEGPDGTFTTYAQAGRLPDGRVYEMVSPIEKAGGEVFPPQSALNLDGSCANCLPGQNLPTMPMQAAPDGQAVAYAGQAFSGGLAAGPNEYLAGRDATGWESNSLSSPLFANGRGSGQGYVALSSDLSRAIVYQISPALSPRAPALNGESYANLYLRDAAGDLTPLVTAAPPNREPRTSANGFNISFAAGNSGTGTSSALSHIAFEADDALTPATADAPEAVDGGVVVEQHGLPSNLNLYEWFEGHLRLINVAPGNTETAPGAVLGSGRLLGAKPFREAVAIDHAVSNDGSRVFWSRESDGQLFVRIDGKETREIADHQGRFITATPDGAKVLLSDGCLYDLETKECEDLTLDEAHAHQGGFQGILGSAEDLSRVYFVDTKALTSPAQANANGEHAEEGAFNLYSWTRGATSFLARLTEDDNRLGNGNEYGDWKASRSQRTAQVSSDGRYLAFMSEASLTGYDNVLKSGPVCANVERNPNCFEVFEYDAKAATLACASCNPTGQQPLGGANLSLLRGFPLLPPLRQPENLTADGEGRLFFESRDKLSARDENGPIQDVYEWEPNGIGDCAQAAGCVSLISSGKSPNDSMFVDSTPSGNDAFFITREQLVAKDRDELLDLYDVRAPHTPGEQLGFPEAETAPCAGETCRGPLFPPPVFTVPGSALFTGLGNLPFSGGLTSPVVKPPLTRAQRLAEALKQCARKPRRKRRSCRALAFKRYGFGAKPGSRKGGK